MPKIVPIGPTVLSFNTGAGSVTINVAGSSNQPNLDAVLELLDASGAVVAGSNPTGLNASITQTLASGTYFIRVKGTGYLDPLSTGYSSYGSLGEYVISGTCVATGTQTAPVAVSSVSASTGTAPLSVSFSSSGSRDSDGVIVSYSWIFGDGTTSTDANPTHVYTAAGTYSAVLTVRDNDGFSTVATALSIKVSAPANVVPVPVISASVTTGVGPLTVAFSSTGSTDSDGTIASYAWSFGDGTTSTLANPSKTYSSVGTFTATLTLTDNSGGKASKSLVITVTQDTNREIDLNSLALTVTKPGNTATFVSTIRILDRVGRAVSGSTVTGSWSGTASGNVSGTTDANGYVTFSGKVNKSTGTETFTVKTISAPASYVYNAALYSTALTKTVTW